VAVLPSWQRYGTDTRAPLRTGRKFLSRCWLLPRDWDPDGEPVQGWLARQIRVTFPRLRRLADADAVQALMATGMIAVIIDGLDDIDANKQPVALRALSQQASCRLVILGRTDEMASAAASRGLEGSVAI